MDRGVNSEISEGALTGRCQVVFASLDLTQDLCHAIGPDDLPESVSSVSSPPPPPPSPSPTRAGSLEEMLGGSLLVWIGGVALALAAAFLVKYSFDSGWIGPPVRVALGIALGVALIGARSLIHIPEPTRPY